MNDSQDKLTIIDKPEVLQPIGRQVIDLVTTAAGPLHPALTLNNLVDKTFDLVRDRERNKLAHDREKCFTELALRSSDNQLALKKEKSKTKRASKKLKQQDKQSKREFKLAMEKVAMIRDDNERIFEILHKSLDAAINSPVDKAEKLLDFSAKALDSRR